MRIVPTAATVGATVEDLDVRTIDGDTWPAIYEAWLHFGVLIFPRQHLDDDEHMAFTLRFGPLERSMAVKRPGAQLDFTRLANVADDDTVVSDPDARITRSLVGNQEWHSDSSFKPIGAKASVLRAITVPASGGETEFADMRAAYDALDQETQRRLDPLTAVHSFAGTGYITEEERRHLAPVRHPLVAVHDETGRRSLFIGRHAQAIEGMADGDARELLESLREAACQPPRTHAHRWLEGDVVIWDNRCVLHRGRPWDMRERRVMRRLTVAGGGDTNPWLFTES